MDVRDIELDSIVIPDNRLRELRDFSGLAESMKEVGQINPITVTEELILSTGRHRVEAAKQLGWKKISAVIVTGDELVNRLREIDENLKRQDLTVWEQSKHAQERERVLDALNERVKNSDFRGNQYTKVDPASEAGSKKPAADIAKEAGMAERTWRKRTKIGREIGEQTAAVLDQADLEFDKHRNLLNSTTQLDHLANISRKHGDDVAAQVAETALSTEGGNIFTVWKRMKGEDDNHVEGNGVGKATADDFKKALEAEREAERPEENGEPLTITRIKQVRELSLTVEFSDGKTYTVPRKTILEHGYKKCKHCSGFGVQKKGTQ